MKLALLLGVLTLSACGDTPSLPKSQDNAPVEPQFGEVVPLEPKFSSLKVHVFEPRCVQCHKTGLANGGVNLESYEALIASVSVHGEPIVVPGQPEQSHLLEALETGRMPLGGTRLPEEQISAVRQWILNGALNN